MDVQRPHSLKSNHLSRIVPLKTMRVQIFCEIIRNFTIFKNSSKMTGKERGLADKKSQKIIHNFGQKKITAH